MGESKRGRVCVCLRKEEGVGNGVCQLSHRLEAKCSTKCIIMVCNHWSQLVGVNLYYIHFVMLTIYTVQKLIKQKLWDIVF